MLATDVDDGHDQQINERGGDGPLAGPVGNHRRVDDRVLDVQVEVQQTISGV